MLFDEQNYRNYLKCFYHLRDDNNEEMRNYKERYVNNFVGNTYIHDICNGSRKLVISLFEKLKIINNSYAILPLTHVTGLNNGDPTWYADIIASYDESNQESSLVSLYILRNYLGFDYKVFLTNDHEEFKDEKGNIIGEYTGFPQFIIKGDINKLLDLLIIEEDKKILRKKLNN